jgi:hypothetical protein
VEESRNFEAGDRGTTQGQSIAGRDDAFHHDRERYPAGRLVCVTVGDWAEVEVQYQNPILIAN